MAVRETAQQADIRWKKLALVQELYPTFTPFLDDVMELLGFHTSDIQHDIAGFIADGPTYLMVQAQRSQAKTTIAAAFAVWSILHDPTAKVLIVSAGGTQANEISTLIIRIILVMPELECLRPDTNNGDRSSVEHFDVHYTLKGVDKSPSVACVGITANLQGKRATLLIADDVESAKNSTTAIQRAQLSQLTLDFSSMSTDRIVWLGTPQSSDSIYNSLPGRGVHVRIWPGRYPTPQQIENYGDHLAPLIKHRIERNPALCFGGGNLGDQGRPIDPLLLGEEKLQAKELDQGTSYFQLQHMLNTRLVDALRYPLKVERLCAMMCRLRMPLEVLRGLLSNTLRDFRVHGYGFKMQSPSEVSQESSEFAGVVAYVDPAGGGINADETGYAITGFLNGNIYLLDAGGLPGGYGMDNLEALAQRLIKWKPTTLKIEKNMGFGAFREVFLPVWRRISKDLPHQCGIEDDYVTGQKEARIIATLEPIINSGRLIVHEDVVEQDAQDCARYAPAHRLTYSLFHQLAKITRDRGSLVHDDRVDALEGAVRHWQEALAIDQRKRVESDRKKAYAKSIEDPLGHRRYEEPKSRRSILNRFRK